MKEYLTRKEAFDIPDESNEIILSLITIYPILLYVWIKSKLNCIRND